jgi:carbamoyltransferase
LTLSSHAPPWVLGLAGSHNGAAALYRGDTLISAIQEERLTRQKRAMLHPGRPSLAVDALLADAGLTPDDLALVVSAPLQAPDHPDHRVDLHPTLGHRPHRVIAHHLAHALSAFACSGFSEATALVVDGLGSSARDLAPAERAFATDPTARETVSIYRIEDGLAHPIDKHFGRAGYADDALPTPLGPYASLGLVYQQVARFSFGAWDAAGKVMGLAPFGRPVFTRDQFFTIDDTLVFDDSLTGLGGDPRLSKARPYPADARLHEDLAASVQAALEDGLLHLVERARRLAPSRRLVCAGGVFLNALANERILHSRLFDEVFVVPFAEDSGTAVGAAFHGVVELLGPRPGRRLAMDALGPVPRDREAALALAASHGARIQDAPPEALAPFIAAGHAVGLFTGRSELGPRALGQRSILFDPRRPEGSLELNALKGREAFRPFAPAVLAADAPRYFNLGPEPSSPFMLRICPVLPAMREVLPAITHVDGTTRPETVSPDTPLGRIVAAFGALTGHPVVLNTSFNQAGEPIVETCTDAVRTALAMPLRALWLDGILVEMPRR